VGVVEKCACGNVQLELLFAALDRARCDAQHDQPLARVRIEGR
jgi:hypothetical protein